MEQNLIAQVQYGDQDAFELLISPYVQPIFNYIAFRVPDAADANDILQETMLSIWQSIKSFQHDSSFKTWAFTIARRRLADFYRNKKVDNVPLDDNLRAEDGLPDSITRMDISAALSKLSDDESELVHLIFHSQLSYKEVSELLNIPVGTIKSRMSGIKSKLKKLIGGGYNGL